MALDERKKRKVQATSAMAECIVADQVPPNRRKEMLDYLNLFGYNPDQTILQVHIPGFFNERRMGQRGFEKKQAAAKRYGGTTFVVVGRTHDPAIMDQVVKPKKKREETNLVYVGYLRKNKDQGGRPPHEVVPIDFTPSHVSYPQDWKNMFATKGFMIAMHVPSAFAKDKNRLTRALYSAGKNADVKKQWDFIDQIKSAGYGQAATDDPLNIINVRLAKGEITQTEYEKLRQTIAA